MKYIWLAVTDDKYELPVYVADSSRKLADVLIVKQQTIIEAVTNNYTIRDKYKIRKVKPND
jgi:hypothetical protein